MMPNFHELRKKYSDMSDKEILKLAKSGNLTASAQQVADMEIEKRDLEYGQFSFDEHDKNNSSEVHPFKKKYKTILNLFFMLLCASFASVIAKGIVSDLVESKVESNSTAKQSEKILEEFIQGAKLINEDSPIVLDEYQVLERAEAGPDPSITYYYSFKNFDDGLDINLWIRNILKPDVVNSVCAAQEDIIRMGGKFKFSYSTSGIFLHKFMVDKEVCGF